MKYLFIILSILCIATVITLFVIWPQSQQVSSSAVVTINDRTLTREELQGYRENDPHHGTNAEFLNKIITKQLLIAEAQRRNIDKEPDFRKALKTFYEHSLIKVLMERVNQEVDITVSDDEVDRFISAYGKTYIFYTLPTSTPVNSELVRSKGTKYTSLFDDLGTSLQKTLASIHIGETATTFMTGNEKIIIYLEDIQGDSMASAKINKAAIKQKLIEEKLEEQLDLWMEDLRKQASITYHNSQE